MNGLRLVEFDIAIIFLIFFLYIIQKKTFFSQIIFWFQQTTKTKKQRLYSFLKLFFSIFDGFIKITSFLGNVF